MFLPRVAIVAELLLATALAVSPGCTRHEDDGPPVRVVLITLDTLRYDAFAGGEGKGALAAAMPLLKARADKGTSFSRFYAATSVTQPTHASMFTALHPWQHNVTRNGIELDDSISTIAEALNDAGFETRAVVASFPCASRFGFGRGFDAYQEEFTSRFPGQHDWAGRDLPESGFFRLAEAVTEHALDAIDRASGSKQYFWFHYFDPHGPYGDSAGKYLVDKMIFNRIRQGEDAASVLAHARQLYRMDVTDLDRKLDRVLARLEADRETIETHVVLVSDHGESLGEGGSVGHGNRLSECEIHVPCVILSPTVAPGVRDDVATSVDIAPTLLGLAGLEPWKLSGRDLRRTEGKARRCGGCAAPTHAPRPPSNASTVDSTLCPSTTSMP